MRQLDYESKQEKTTTCESDVNSQQKSAVKADVETCSKPVSVNHKLAKRDLEMSIPVEATSKVEQARVAAKRGKIARNSNAISSTALSNLLHDCSVKLREVGEGEGGVGEYGKMPNIKKKENAGNVNFANKVISKTTTIKNYIDNLTGQTLRISPDFHDFTLSQYLPFKSDKASVSFDNRKFSINKLNKPVHSIRHIKKNCTVSKTEIQAVSECGISENKCNAGSLDSDNCQLSPDIRCKQVLIDNVSFSRENRITSKKLKSIKSFEDINLIFTQNLRSNRSSLLKSAIHSPKLNMTKCYINPSENSREISRGEAGSFLEQYAESNLSPPPLSTLQIFAISRKPLNVQMAPTDDILNNIDELPSLPMINHVENKSEERKLSILEPPPPGLVSRQESNESWNRFLIQLNSILESRAGEFV